MTVKEINSLIKSKSGLLILGFIRPSNSVSGIISRRYKRMISSLKIDYTFTEFDCNQADELSLREFGVFDLPTYQFYYNGELVKSMVSYVSEHEILDALNVFRELIEFQK